MSPRESQLTDPQHHLMLETVWHALEDSGTGPHDEVTTTAVFASSTGSSYLRKMLASTTDPAAVDQIIHGTEQDFMASRVAYKLGLTCPVLANLVWERCCDQDRDQMGWDVEVTRPGRIWLLVMDGGGRPS